MNENEEQGVETSPKPPERPDPKRGYHEEPEHTEAERLKPMGTGDKIE